MASERLCSWTLDDLNHQNIQMANLMANDIFGSMVGNGVWKNDSVGDSKPTRPSRRRMPFARLQENREAVSA